MSARTKQSQQQKRTKPIQSKSNGKVTKLKAKANGSGAGNGAESALTKRIQALTARLEDGKASIAQFSNATDEAWTSIRDGLAASRDTLKTSFSDAASKFRS